jgi:chorismate synthase
MGGNIIGERFLAMSFGESHGRCVGIVVDGCPAGMPLNESDIQGQLDLRKPGQSVVTTQRKEEDKVEILSGVFNGFTTGAPICMLIWNKDSDSLPYEIIKNIPRPGLSGDCQVWRLCRLSRQRALFRQAYRHFSHGWRSRTKAAKADTWH